MTDRKDWKRRIRERMAATGQSYTTARMHLIAEHDAPFEVEEMHDVSELAAEVGLRCRVVMSGSLDLPPVRLLACVRDALIATEGDKDGERMRRAALHGEPVPPSYGPAIWMGRDAVDDFRKFFRRVRAGLGGFTKSGASLALHVDGVPVLVSLHRRPGSDAPGSLVLSALDGHPASIRTPT